MIKHLSVCRGVSPLFAVKMVVLGVRCNGPRPAQYSLGHTFPADFNFKPSFPGFRVGTRGRCVANASSPKNTGSPQQAGTHKPPVESDGGFWVVITQKKQKKGGTTGRQRISKRFPDDFLSRMFEMPRVGTTPWVRRSNNHPKFRRPRCPLHCCTHAKRGPLGLRSGEAASPSSFSEVRCVICDGCVRRYNNKGRPPRSATLSPSPLPLIHPAEAAHTPAPLYPLGLELLLAVRTPFATSIDGTTRFSPTCDFRSRSSRTWSPTLLSFFSSSRQTKHSSVVPAFLLSCVVTKKGRDRKRNRQTRTALHTGRLTKWELVSRQLANSKKSRGVPKEGRKR